MEEEHSQIREEIERTRDDLVEKAAALSDRASSAAQKLKLSHHIEQRPFAMLGISVAAGFLVQRLLFRRRHEPNVLVVNEDEIENAPRRIKRKMMELREQHAGEEFEEERAPVWEREPMKAVARAGQLAAAALAREVTSRLVGRATTHTTHH